LIFTCNKEGSRKGADLKNFNEYFKPTGGKYDLHRWRFIKNSEEVGASDFESDRYDLTLQSEISDVLKASATSEALENPSSKTLKPRNPQGYTEAVERYDTNSLIPILSVR